MSTTAPDGQLIPEIGVMETVESDNILRWDGTNLYVEQDVFHNGQLVHRRYRKRVTKSVAQAIAAMIGQH
ncbi:hypothetical protein [Ancylobacter sp.]|uniref:hypothetical protein n=1 Tax=Ancylobacter sp. TaxID=1872567 RepID=UPI003D139534